jgi:hypothetical protein
MLLDAYTVYVKAIIYSVLLLLLLLLPPPPPPLLLQEYNYIQI